MLVPVYICSEAILKDVSDLENTITTLWANESCPTSYSCMAPDSMALINGKFFTVTTINERRPTVDRPANSLQMEARPGPGAYSFQPRSSRRQYVELKVGCSGARDETLPSFFQ